MFRKILITEDIDSISLSITAMLEKNFDAEIINAKYCDEGYLFIKKAAQDEKPFDLVITDLSFKDDHRDTTISSGEDFIKKIREEFFDLKIIVYSIEDRPFLIKSLFNNSYINAYVAKGRDSISELTDAIHNVYYGNIYLSPEFADVLKDQSVFEVDKYDVEVLKLLSEGFTQEDISVVFKQKNYPSPSTSSIEKKINKLKFMFKANNSIHLVAITKDMRLI